MHSTVCCQLTRQLGATGKEPELAAIRRRRALRRVDRELSRDNLKSAVSLVKQLQRNPAGCLRGFGAARQVPKRVLSLDELELGAKELLTIQSLLDSVMDSIEGCNILNLLDEPLSDGVESLVEDESNGSISDEDYIICMQHEAGHFLVSYLLGVLPQVYEVPSIEAPRHDKSPLGRVKFIGFEFLDEVAAYKDSGQVSSRAKRNKISSKTLNNFSCVTLGGLVAEHIAFGHSRGHYSDLDKLGDVFRWLGYKESEAHSHVRWAALNTVLISHHHSEVRSRLAEAMASGRSVGLCIDTIENALHGKDV